MNLIDKYIAEVGKHLPRRNRADIEAEIRSTLEDMLDERKPADGQLDDETVVQLLKEYGAPRQVAESYGGKQYLIGPNLYPTFLMVTKIVVSVLVTLALIGLGLELAQSELTGPGFLSTVGKYLLELLSGLMAAFGNIALVFAILERTLPASSFGEEVEEWDPAKLASEPDPDKVNFGEQIFGIIFLALLLILFNFYPQVLGFGFFGEFDSAWMLSDAFYSYLPWINLLLLIEIGSAVYLLRKGFWSVGTRIADIMINLAGIVLAVIMLTGPALVEVSTEQLAGTPLSESAEFFARVTSWLPNLVLAIVIIVSGVEVVQMIYRLIKSRKAEPYPMIK
ncbi:MAG TPA: hypothetical protein VJ785_17010 [Anaerolineales bacterium]|nr:hypothetical protein [Anaerolineales bacterium]